MNGKRRTVDPGRLHAPLPTQEHWAILGGGMLGLTLADQLQQLGQRVTIIEANDSLGGLVQPWQIGPVTWDRFYHVILQSDQALRSLLSQLGLDSSIRWVTTKTGFYCDKRLVSLSNSIDFLKFPPLNLWEKFRLGMTIFYGSKISRWEPLEQMPASEWLIRWSGRSTYRKIWQPLLRAKLGSAYEQASAAFIWAYIARMYKARRSGLKTEMFGYIPGGYATILRAVENKLQAIGQIQFMLRCPVAEVTTVASGKQIRISTMSGAAHDFDRCISTLPGQQILANSPGLTKAEQVAWQSIPYIGIDCVSLLLNRPLGPYYVTNIADTTIPMTAVINMSTIVPREETHQYELVYLPYYRPASEIDLLPPRSSVDSTITGNELDAYLNGLQRIYPNFRSEQVVAARVARARNVMAIPVMHYSTTLPPICTSIPRYYTLNSAWITGGTLNVNETIELAERGLRDFILPSIAHKSRSE